MKTNIFILSFLLFNFLIINKITAQTPIRFRAENGYIGLYDEASGKVVTQPIYLYIDVFSEGIANAVIKGDADNGFTVYLNEKGEKINLNNYSSHYGRCRNGLIPIKIAKDKNEYEYINKTGEKALEGTFLNARNFSDGYAVVVKANKENGFIDVNGKFCFEKQLENIQKKLKAKSKEKRPLDYGSFSGGAALIKSSDKKNQYILNIKGEVFDMSPTIEKIENNTLFPNKIKKKLFSLDEGGSYFLYEMNDEGTFRVHSYIGVFMFDEKNKFIGNFLSVESVGQKRFLVTTEKKESYFMDINGKRLSPNTITNGLYSYNDDYIILKKDKETLYSGYSVFDKNLKEIKVKNLYNYGQTQSMHLITLEKDVQMINGIYPEDIVVVPSVYVDDVAQDGIFHNVNAFDFPIIIKSKGKWGAINQQGKLIIPCEYDQIMPFKGNYFTTAIKNGKKMKITRNNKILD